MKQSGNTPIVAVAAGRLPNGFGDDLLPISRIGGVTKDNLRKAVGLRTGAVFRRLALV